MTLHPTALTACPRRVDSCHYDAFEMGLLPVIRHMLTTYRSPETQAWVRAQTVAVERWGETVGLALCQRMQGVIRMLWECRKSDLSFMDPLDLDQRALLSDDEEALMDMLHHMRRDQTPKARDAVERLTGGMMDPHLIREGLKLAARFPAVGEATPSRHSGTRLSVVGGTA